MSYNKLVRDKIPDIIRKKGEDPEIRILSDEEYKKELEKKLLEEYHEVLEASGTSRIEELADMLEVIIALARIDNKSLEDVIKVAEEKREKRGGFKEKIYLKGVKNRE